jgi:hypothetical protein
VSQRDPLGPRDKLEVIVWITVLLWMLIGLALWFLLA